MRDMKKNVYLAALFASALGAMACYTVALPAFLSDPARGAIAAGRFFSCLGLGGMLSIFIAKLTARLSGRFAVALFGAILALGAGIAYASCVGTLNTSTLAIGMLVLGAGQFAALGRVQARVVGEARPAKSVPYIFLTATATWILVQFLISAQDATFFLATAGFALFLACLSLVGPGEPRAESGSETAPSSAGPATEAPRRSNFLAIFFGAPAFFATIFVSSIFASNFFFSEWGKLSRDVFPNSNPTALSVVLQIAEIATLATLTWLIAKVGGLKRAIVAALVVSAARYFLLGFAEPTSAFIAMLAHGLMYVGLQSVVPALYVDRCFTDESERKNAQTLLAVAAFAAPSAASGLVAEALERAATNADGAIAWSQVFWPAALVLGLVAAVFAIFGRTVDAETSADNAETNENADAA